MTDIKEKRSEKILVALPGILFMLSFVLILLFDLALKPDIETQADVFTAMVRIINAFAFILSVIVFIRKGRKAPVMENLKKRPWILFFSGFLALTAVSTLINGVNRDALLGIEYRNVGVPSFFAYIIGYLFLSSFALDERRKKAAAYVFVLGSDLIALASLWHVFIRPIAAFQGKKALSAVFLNGNHYGYFIVTALLVCFMLTVMEKSFLRGIFAFASFVLESAVLIINNSMGCFIAAFAGIVFAGIVLAVKGLLNRRYFILLLCPPALLAGGYFLMDAGFYAPAIEKALTALYRNLLELSADLGNILSSNALAASSGSNRMKLWKEALELILKKPLFGYGCEGTSELLGSRFGIYNAHNELLTVAGYFGIISAVLYLAGITGALVTGAGNISEDTPASAGFLLAAFGYLISSMFGTTMFYTLPLLFLFLGYSQTTKN